MYHPFAVEWLYERMDGIKSENKCIMIINVKRGSSGLLCVGCPVPHQCSYAHQKTFRVGPNTNYAYMKLNQNQIQNQSEVLMVPSRYLVTDVKSFRLEDIPTWGYTGWDGTRAFGIKRGSIRKD